MKRQVINLGKNKNDGSGDPIRVAFEKTNANFEDLYSIVNTIIDYLELSKRNITPLTENLTFKNGTLTVKGAIDATDDITAHKKSKLAK